jgi:hypothetical protein
MSLLQIGRQLPGRPFGSLERDIAGEPLGHHHIDGALAEVVAFDEADILDRQLEFPQLPSGFLDLFDSLDLLDPDIEQAHGRSLDSEQTTRQCLAHDGEVHQLIGIRPDRRPDIEHDALAPERGPDGGDGRPVDPRHGVENDLGHRHHRSGIAGRNRHVRLPPLHRLDCLPHAADTPSPQQRLARLVLHADRNLGMVNRRLGGDGRIVRQQTADPGSVAIKPELDLRMALKRQGRAWKHHIGPEVAAHRIQRYHNLLSHSHTHRLGPRPVALPH